MKQSIKYLIAISLVIIFQPASGQDIDLERSIDKLITKAQKARKVKLTDRADDSTGRTYEFSKKTGTLLLACFKTVHSRVTTEYHYHFKDGLFLRMNLSQFDFNTKKAIFIRYYFKEQKLVSASPFFEMPEPHQASEILTNAANLYNRAVEMYSHQTK